MKGRLFRRVAAWLMVGILVPWAAESARAQTLLVEPDDYGIPYGEPLVVEPFGVLENDTLDGEPAGENGVTAELVDDVQHGTLVFLSDGSFTYTPGIGFDGIDAFTYNAVFGTITAQATVTLSACTGGPPLFACWNEAAYLAKAAALGFSSFGEGFEDDGAWGVARSPDTVPTVTSRGIGWWSNHPDPPASNEITTGSGPARTGQWGIFDREHGYATGTPAECDIDVPPQHCLFHDGFSGTRTAGGGALHGVGGFITGTIGANVAIILDGTDEIGFGHIGSGHQFFGAIDARVAGFRSFEVRELDGKVGQELMIFADDFSFLLDSQGPVCDIVSDSDDDGVDDSCDNCLLKFNPDQIDTDGDGCGNQCDPDFTQDGIVGAGDFFWLAGVYGSLVPPASPNYDVGPDPLDGVIGAADFFLLATCYAGPPGPSGTTSGTTACP